MTHFSWKLYTFQVFAASERLVIDMKNPLCRTLAWTFLWLALPSFLAAQEAEFYPLELVKPGQKGTGKTIFSGSQIESFEVEILGVLKNFGPKQNLILARLSGARVEETGVFEGMSGSPVYLEGRILGAVAFAFAFSTEPVAGITPIAEMVDIFKNRPPRQRRIASASRAEELYRIQEEDWQAASGFPALPEADIRRGEFGDLEGRLRPIATPLNLSGFSQQALSRFAPQFRALGLSPVRGLVSAGSAEASEAGNGAPLMPGSTISVQLVRGDMGLSASGTVTHVSGSKVYAFGHPFLSLGNTDMPMNQASVITVIKSLQSSQKVSALERLVGSVRQDRATGLFGILGAKPELLPMRLRLQTSRNEVKEYNYEVVHDSFLTPFMINLTVNNAIVSSERSLGGQTLRVKCDIQLKGQPNVVYESNIADLASTPALAAVTLSAPVRLLLGSGFEDLKIERVDFDIVAVEEARRAELVKVWQDKLEARPGEEIHLTVFLRRENGLTTVEKHTLRIPEGISPGPLHIEIGDGLTVSRLDNPGEGRGYVPESLSQLVKAINNLKKNDRLYIRLYREQSGAVIGGEGMPGLPPSLLSLYNSRKTAGDVDSIQRVVYFEMELPAQDYALSGRKVLRVNIKG